MGDDPTTGLVTVKVEDVALEQIETAIEEMDLELRNALYEEASPEDAADPSSVLPSEEFEDQPVD